MLTKLLRTISEYWVKLSRREQSLAMVVGLLVLLMAGFMMVRNGIDRVRMLDRAIDRLQQDIINYEYQIARKEHVEGQYARVAKQHSSEWTEAEIHDRLRQEIYRLSQKVPPALDKDGIPVRTSGGEKLVEIPALREGTMDTSAADFRAYELSFRIPSASFLNIVDFLQRMQGSPQSLRIDALEINRSPLNNVVEATLDITRIVVAGAEEAQLEEDLGLSPDEMLLDLDPDEWVGEGVELKTSAAYATVEGYSLFAEATQEAATLHLLRQLEIGSTYSLQVDLSHNGVVWLDVRDDASGDPYPGGKRLEGEDVFYRYMILFTVKGEGTGRSRVRVPCLRLNTPGSRVYLNRLVLTKVE